MWQAHLFRGICYGVKFMYTSAAGHIAEYNGFIWGIYVVFEGHIFCWHIYGSNLVNKSWDCVGLLLTYT